VCRVLAVAVAVATGCSSGPATDADAAPVNADAGDANPGVRVGRVQVATALDLANPMPQSHARAEVGIAGLPSMHAEDRMTAVMTAGECRLLEALAPACDPPCVSDWSCMADGTCHYNNFGVDAGEVTLAGLEEALALRFTEGYAAFREDVLLTAGAEVTASAPGGTWAGGTAAGFAVSGTAPEDLDLAIADGVLPLDDVAATTLTWTPSAEPDARYSLRIATPHGHAGSSTHILACDGPDTGTLSIAPELAAVFPALDVPNCWGLTCVPAELRRYTRSVATTADGSVTLELGASRWFWVDH
jgi:hypothetical protein